LDSIDGRLSPALGVPSRSNSATYATPPTSQGPSRKRVRSGSGSGSGSDTEGAGDLRDHDSRSKSFFTGRLPCIHLALPGLSSSATARSRKRRKGKERARSITREHMQETRAEYVSPAFSSDSRMDEVMGLEAVRCSFPSPRSGPKAGGLLDLKLSYCRLAYLSP
jgi:hypothetical protein